MTLFLEEINEFTSLNEFLRFEKWLDGHIKNGDIIETSVKSYYLSINTQERWFQCLLSHEIWRLVYPDASFRGYWGLVENNHITK